MNVSRALHQTAMEYSTFAKVAKAKGMLEESRAFYKKAFELEQEASLKIAPDKKDPVPRFILKRSTAALAYKAGFYFIANKLIVSILSENPPAFIKEELKELSELIKKADTSKSQEDHLKIHGKLTSANENKYEIEVEDIITQQFYSIFVPAERMKEIVKSYFSEEVFIQAITSPEGFLILKKISKAA